MTIQALRKKMREMLEAQEKYVRDSISGDWGCAESNRKDVERIKEEIVNGFKEGRSL